MVVIHIDKIQPIQCPAGHRRDCVNKRTCVFRHIGEAVGDALEATRGDLPMFSCGEDDAVDIVNRNQIKSNQSVNNVNKNMKYYLAQDSQHRIRQHRIRSTGFGKHKNGANNDIQL